ncbi:MAG: hypothetical protein NT046_10610 [Arenimonas sp.]|nr:hypothetical protein [Arenimonas sp.]
MRLTRTLIAASLLLSTAAFAADGTATLVNQQGTVLVNQGEEFVTATQAQALKAGDRVMVMEGGTAQISFADGCVLPLASGSMAVVPETSTCAGAIANVEQIGPSYAQAVGAPVRDLRCEDDDTSNNDFDNDGGDDCCEINDNNSSLYTDGAADCPAPAYVAGNNRGAGWVFGAWTAGIAWALIDGNYSIRPVSP